ncbi:MAG: putative metal-binding motif-containing protein [Myxococcota bacterium]|nr:putative metal-binding motif-containing protein [Myxococcota bacterium]MDW8362218.1 putative metal-binding motif-containing protein [Myxococcales bacterium]
MDRARPLAICALLGGCAPDAPHLTWRYRFESVQTESRTVHLEARIRRGSCAESAPIGFETEFPRNAPREAATPGTLGRGSWGFELVARDATCTAVARGCRVVHLPLGGTIEVLLTDVAGAGCPAGARCVHGRCLMPRDAALVDAGPDAPLDGTLPDSAPNDAAEDARPDARPDASMDACRAQPERCNGRDDDCNGLVDDGPDRDRDGVTEPCDCDDGNPWITPGRAEVCDHRDNDCNGLDDDGPDADGDGATSACDCDDANPARTPGRAEECDLVDNDCDGSERADCCSGDYALARVSGRIACVSAPRGPTDALRAYHACMDEGASLVLDTATVDPRPCGLFWFVDTSTGTPRVGATCWDGFRGWTMDCVEEGRIDAWTAACPSPFRPSCADPTPPMCSLYYICERPVHL